MHIWLLFLCVNMIPRESAVFEPQPRAHEDSWKGGAFKAILEEKGYILRPNGMPEHYQMVLLISFSQL